MMTTSTPRSITGAIVSIVLASVTTATLADEDGTRICTFGDSLSDTGNHFVVNQEVSVAPFAPIPPAPYPIGGLTFSNGKTWIQQLAHSAGRTQDALPAFRNGENFCNYAFATARARQVGEFDLPDQVTRYLHDTDGAADTETLYVLFIGGNDVRDAIGAYVVGNTDEGDEILGAAVTLIAASIGRLNAVAGARKFLVLNVPNLALVPAIWGQGPGAQYLAYALSVGFNSALTNALMNLAAGDLDITEFDTFSFFNAMAVLPPAGVSNVTQSCITPGVVEGAICADPDRYAFWDGIHPTRVIHAALAVAVAAGL